MAIIIAGSPCCAKSEPFHWAKSEGCCQMSYKLVVTTMRFRVK